MNKRSDVPEGRDTNDDFAQRELNFSNVECEEIFQSTFNWIHFFRRRIQPSLKRIQIFSYCDLFSQLKRRLCEMRLFAVGRRPGKRVPTNLLLHRISVTNSALKLRFSGKFVFYSLLNDMLFSIESGLRISIKLNRFPLTSTFSLWIYISV